MKKLLVMLPNNLGDVIMAMPMLHALKSRTPQPHISFLVEEGYEAGLVASPVCDRVIPFRRKQLKAAAEAGTWRSAVGALQSFVNELNAERFDRVINLSQTGYLSYIAALLAATELDGRRFLREGNHALPDRWSQYLYAIPFARRYNTLHATDVYSRIAGVKAGAGSSLTIKVTDAEGAAAARCIAARGIDPAKPFVLLQPGAAYPSKRWPPEHFIALGKQLVNAGFSCVVTGAPSERETARTIADALEMQCCTTAGECSFRETIAICSLATAVVSGDTAIMHAAAALGRRVVALFGPTSPVETGPYGDGHVVLTGSCPQKPCFKTTCGSMQCLMSITPAAVFAAVTAAPVTQSGCHRFVTGFDDNDYRLKPENGGEDDYCDRASAAAIRALYEGGNLQQDGSSQVCTGLQEFAALCIMMDKMLVIFEKSGDGLYLRRFEELRQQAASLGGCTAFVNAVLNIRLNSIALLDPVAGLAETGAVCRQVAGEITRGTAR